MRLVTIATFGEAPQAHLARNALEAAGIQAAIADESLIGMDWLMSNAIGGVKVQVREEDAERAVAVLEESLGNTDPVDPQQLAEEAEAEPPEDETLQSAGAVDPPEPVVALPNREDYARRFVFASILAVFCAPAAFYAVYLFMNAMFSDGELSSRGRMNLWIGSVLTVAMLFFLWMAGILRMFF